MIVCRPLAKAASDLRLPSTVRGPLCIAPMRAWVERPSWHGLPVVLVLEPRLGFDRGLPTICPSLVPPAPYSLLKPLITNKYPLISCQRVTGSIPLARTNIKGLDSNG